MKECGFSAREDEKFREKWRNLPKTGAKNGVLVYQMINGHILQLFDKRQVAESYAPEMVHDLGEGVGVGWGGTDRADA